MIIAELPGNEDLRLNDLISFEILDTKAENDFDDLVELAGQICKCPISLITLVDEDRQWFKAKKGLVVEQTSRDIAFCAHAILQDEVMVVEDATKDERFFDNPLVTGDLNIRFYAGSPIMSVAGNKIGTLCIIDHKPKQLTAEEERALVILSNQVSKLIELRKKNILLRKRAEEIIDLKSKTISSVLKAQEKDIFEIASTLHEDLAQSLASSMIYLDVAAAQEEDRLPLIKKVKQDLSEIMKGMKNLAYQITPYTLNWMPAEDLVREFAEKISDTFSFDINVQMQKGKNKGTADNALTAIRVMEHWLKVLSDKKGISLVNILIQTSNNFELIIEDDSEEISIADFKKQVFESEVYERVNAQGGTIDLATTPNGKNVLKIMLPYAVPSMS